MKLDEMLALPEPERSKALEAFYAESDEPVKLKPAQRGTFKVRHRGKVITVPPGGQWFGRKSAVDMLLCFGIDGRYRGQDMETGHTEQTLMILSEEERQRLESKPSKDGVKGFHILDMYLECADEKTDINEPELAGVAS